MSDDKFKADTLLKQDFPEEQELSLAEKFKSNLIPGITVALVSVPLSTALAIAAGAKPMMGLSTAVYGPALGGIFGGSNYNIFGPAGALVNILNKFSTEYGHEIIPYLAFFGGILSFLVFALGLERYCMLIPISVLEGFSVSVAIAIGFGQFNSAFGLYGLPHYKEFYMNTYTTFANIQDISFVEFIPFLIMFVSLVTLLKKFPKHPWIIAIAIFGIIYGFITKEFIPSIKPKLLMDVYPEMKNPSLFDFSYFKAPKVTVSAVVFGSIEVAFVAVLETLISARIADNMTGTRFNQSKEVFALGLGNILAGLMGGTPCTGVLVRTSVNVKSGANDKISQFINAMTVLVVVLVVMPIFVYTPLPCIAAILVTSSVRLFPLSIMKSMWVQDKAELVILFVTASVCVLIDGAFGLMAGGIISIMRTAIKSQSADVCDIDYHDTYMTIKLRGQLSYISGSHVEEALLEAIKANPDQNMVLDLYSVPFIDMDGIEVLKTVIKAIKSQFLVRVDARNYDCFVKSPLLSTLEEKGQIIDCNTEMAQIEAKFNNQVSLN